MASKLTLPGTYAFHFSGFDRDGARARYITGLGRIVLVATDATMGTLSYGRHWSTNSPMFGGVTPAQRLRHSVYELTGSYEILEAGPPLVAALNIEFRREGDDSPPERVAMSDRFLAVQSGPDRFRLMSTDPRTVAGTPEKIDELVLGESIKVDPATW